MIVADYTMLSREMTIAELLAMTHAQREEVERRVAVEVANELHRRLPRTPEARVRLLESGQALVRRMSWDRVLEQKLGPVVRRVMGERATP